MEIIAVQDPWVCIRLHDDPASDRWLNFDWISAYHLQLD